MASPTVSRVRRNTAHEINERLSDEASDRIAYFAEHRDEIDHRLSELDREWDIERAIQANAATLALAGTVLGATDRRWLALPGLVTAFLLQHALQGWCPPVPVLRRLGFRTAHEIASERHALKALRGDYDPVRCGSGSAAAAERAAKL